MTTWTPAIRLRTTGPSYDPWCPRCDYGWVNKTDPDGHEWTYRCPDCQARSEARGATTTPPRGHETKRGH